MFFKRWEEDMMCAQRGGDRDDSSSSPIQKVGAHAEAAGVLVAEGFSAVESGFSAIIR